MRLLYALGWRARITEWVTWVPRRWNRAADRLANEAMDEPDASQSWRRPVGSATEAVADTGIILMSDAGIREREGKIGRGWLALQAGTGDLLACEAVPSSLREGAGDVTLEEMEALRAALSFAVGVAMGWSWESWEVAGKVLREGVVDEVRALAKSLYSEAISLVG